MAVQPCRGMNCNWVVQQRVERVCHRHFGCKGVPSSWVFVTFVAGVSAEGLVLSSGILQSCPAALGGRGRGVSCKTSRSKTWEKRCY
jgi:hypothetical protein